MAATASQPSDCLPLVHTTADEFEISVVTGQTLAFRAVRGNP